jgi:hypothetical protein
MAQAPQKDVNTHDFHIQATIAFAKKLEANIIRGHYYQQAMEEFHNMDKSGKSEHQILNTFHTAALMDVWKGFALRSVVSGPDIDTKGVEIFNELALKNTAQFEAVFEKYGLVGLHGYTKQGFTTEDLVAKVLEINRDLSMTQKISTRSLWDARSSSDASAKWKSFAVCAVLHGPDIDTNAIEIFNRFCASSAGQWPSLLQKYGLSPLETYQDLTPVELANTILEMAKELNTLELSGPIPIKAIAAIQANAQPLLEEAGKMLEVNPKLAEMHQQITQNRAEYTAIPNPFLQDQQTQSEQENYVTLKTKELKGYCLDWAVGSLNQDWYLEDLLSNLVCDDDGEAYSPSTNYAQGVPLMDEANISMEIKHDGWRLACIYDLNDEKTHIQLSHDYLISGMRCLVDAKLGETVNVPLSVYEMAVMAKEYPPIVPLDTIQEQSTDQDAPS